MKITCFLTVVEVDLTAAHFRPGKPNYDRVKWSLSERMGEDVDFVMCHSASGTPLTEMLPVPNTSLLGCRHWYSFPTVIL